MKVATILLASGEPWESAFLAAAASGGIVVLKRCVDLTDLLATAALGQSRAVVVSARTPRLDAEAVRRLRADGLEVVAVGAPEEADRMSRLGASSWAPTGAAEIMAAILETVARREELRVPQEAPEPPVRVGRTVVVWGPGGAPGRTTVALAVAAEAAAAGRRTVLVDADPYGGCVAPRLGILDEASGLLAVARSSNAGTLRPADFAAACRRAAPEFDVLTGLPRADRRIEVRPEMMTVILGTAVQLSDVVVDTGFSIEVGDRDAMTRESLEMADEIVVVGQADPVGLARLVRALVDLAELLDGAPTPVRTVLNRYRAGLGWAPEEVLALVDPYVGPAPVRIVPQDLATFDGSLSSGRSLVEMGTSPARDVLREVAADCFPGISGPATPRRRRAGRARRR